MSRKTILFLLLLLTRLLSGHKTIMAQSQPLSLQEMVAASGFIFSGKVINVWSERDAATGFVVTCSTVAVQDAVRGVDSAHFTFKQYGGSYNGLNVFIADMSYFTAGEEIFAFLYPLSALELTSPIGTIEGKLTIQRDPQTGKRIVLGNLSQAKMLEPFAGKTHLSVMKDEQSTVTMEYDHFMALVRDMAARERLR